VTETVVAGGSWSRESLSPCARAFGYQASARSSRARRAGDRAGQLLRLRPEGAGRGASRRNRHELSSPPPPGRASTSRSSRRAATCRAARPEHHPSVEAAHLRKPAPRAAGPRANGTSGISERSRPRRAGRAIRFRTRKWSAPLHEPAARTQMQTGSLPLEFDGPRSRVVSPELIQAALSLVSPASRNNAPESRWRPSGCWR